MTTRWLVLAVTLGLSACRPQTGVAPARREQADLVARQAIAAESTLVHTPLDERTIGVSAFAAEPTDTLVGPLAYALPDLLLGDLARSHSITVVDRVRLDALERELHLASTGAIDTTTAPRVGRLLGAGRLVVGDLGRLTATAQTLVVDVRIADVGTSRVMTGFSLRAPVDEVIDIEKALAFRLFDVLGVTLTPAEQAAMDQRPTRNLAALLAYGRGVRDESAGDERGAAREYRRAIGLDPNFREARTHLGAVQPAADVYPQLTRAIDATSHAINPSPLDPPPVSRPGGSVPPSTVPTPAPVTVSVTVTATP
jgi:hypothetical protein